MYRKILVPLDGSERAERILPFVEALAHQFGAKLILLQVVEPIVTGISPYDTAAVYAVDEVDRRTQQAKQYLMSLQGRMHDMNIDAQTQVEFGSVVSTILDAADENDVDLIALASHGRTGLARVFYGSVAAGILNRSVQPLLVIRAQE